MPNRQTIEIQSVKEIVTAKSGRDYFTFENYQQENFICFIPKLYSLCSAGDVIDAEIEKREGKDSILVNIYELGKPVYQAEAKGTGRSYGKSDKELLQVKQLAEAQNRSIQAQTALNRAVDLAVAGKLIILDALSPDVSVPEIDERIVYLQSIKILAGEFYQLLQSLTQISEAKVIYHEAKGDENEPIKIYKEQDKSEVRQDSGEGIGEERESTVSNAKELMAWAKDKGLMPSQVRSKMGWGNSAITNEMAVEAYQVLKEIKE